MIEKGVVSRSGRYLAYVNYGHAGMCANSSAIDIVDLWDRRVARPQVTSENKDDITSIERIDWSSPSVLEYDAAIHGYTTCREGKTVERPVKESIDVATLVFN